MSSPAVSEGDTVSLIHSDEEIEKEAMMNVKTEGTEIEETEIEGTANEGTAIEGIKIEGIAIEGTETESKVDDDNGAMNVGGPAEEIEEVKVVKVAEPSVFDKVEEVKPAQLVNLAALTADELLAEVERRREEEKAKANAPVTWIKSLDDQSFNKLHAELEKLDKMYSYNYRGREKNTGFNSRQIRVFPIKLENIADEKFHTFFKRCPRTTIQLVNHPGRQLAGMLILTFRKDKEYNEALKELAEHFPDLNVYPEEGAWKDKWTYYKHNDQIFMKNGIFLPSLPPSMSQDELTDLFPQAINATFVRETPRSHGFIEFASDPGPILEEMNKSPPNIEGLDFCGVLSYDRVMDIMQNSGTLLMSETRSEQRSRKMKKKTEARESGQEKDYWKPTQREQQYITHETRLKRLKDRNEKWQQRQNKRQQNEHQPQKQQQNQQQQRQRHKSPGGQQHQQNQQQRQRHKSPGGQQQRQGRNNNQQGGMKRGGGGGQHGFNQPNQPKNKKSRWNKMPANQGNQKNQQKKGYVYDPQSWHPQNTPRGLYGNSFVPSYGYDNQGAGGSGSWQEDAAYQTNSGYGQIPYQGGSVGGAAYSTSTSQSPGSMETIAALTSLASGTNIPTLGSGS